METFNNRLKLLIKENYESKNYLLAKAIGINEGTVSRWLKSEVVPNVKSETRELIRSIGISPEWLFEGLGEMLFDMNKPLVNGNKKGVPFFSADVTASFVRSFDDSGLEPEFYVDYKPFNDCNAYFPIFGDSMFPMFASGEIIVVKTVKNSQYIQWGEPYLVITDEQTNNMRTVKLLHPNEEDKDSVILRASNPSYKGDLVVPKSSIVSLHFVKGKITRRSL